jgi:RNA polymerase sigma-70 factor (ECF subfamily)
MGVNTSDVTDADLWARARQGDGNAFAEVFGRHADSVFTHCFRRTGSRTDADDLTSLVFFQAWRNADRVRFVDGAILPWLLVVATNVARNESRARRRYQRLLERLPAHEDTHDIADEAISNVEAERHAALLGACIRRLSKKEQAVIALCLLSEMSYAAAADVLGVPIGTVRSRLSRARTKLQALLTESAPADRTTSVAANTRPTAFAKPRGGSS